MEAIKKIFKIGIYGQVEQITKYLKDKYNIENCFLHRFTYNVQQFPKEFQDTCLYLGLKLDTQIFSVGCKLIGTETQIAVLAPPIPDDYNSVIQTNWWKKSEVWYYVAQNVSGYDLQTNIEDMFIRLQKFCNMIDLFGKYIKGFPKLNNIENDSLQTTTEGEQDA